MRRSMRNRSSKLELITNESIRKHTFEKRKANLVKKMSEVTILCDVDAFLIIYDPKPNGEPFKLDTVWPSDSDKVERMIGRYKNTNQLKKSYTVSDYFADKKKTFDSDTAKLHEKINGIKYPSWDARLDNCSVDELKALVARLDHKSELAREKLDVLRQNHNDGRLQLSENFGNYMVRNNFSVENKLTLAPPLPLSMPVRFQPGPSWFVPQQQQQQQQIFLGRGETSETRIEYENMMRSQSAAISNEPIWQGQDYVNTFGWKLNNYSNNNNFQTVSHHQLPPPQHYSDMDPMESAASWSGSNRFNH